MDAYFILFWAEQLSVVATLILFANCSISVWIGANIGSEGSAVILGSGVVGIGLCQIMGVVGRCAVVPVGDIDKTFNSGKAFLLQLDWIVGSVHGTHAAAYNVYKIDFVEGRCGTQWRNILCFCGSCEFLTYSLNYRDFDCCVDGMVVQYGLYAHKRFN